MHRKYLWVGAYVSEYLGRVLPQEYPPFPLSERGFVWGHFFTDTTMGFITIVSPPFGRFFFFQPPTKQILNHHLEMYFLSEMGIFQCHLSFQDHKFAHTNYSDLTRPGPPNGGLVRENLLFQGNLGWWNIFSIWPDTSTDDFTSSHPHLYTDRSSVVCLIGVMSLRQLRQRVFFSLPWKKEHLVCLGYLGDRMLPSLEVYYIRIPIHQPV